MHRTIFKEGAIFLLLLLLISQVSALTFQSGDSIRIDEPIDDDVFATVEYLQVNAPVRSLTFAGKELQVNAPITTNLIAAGEKILIKGPVGVDVIAAGSNLTFTNDIGGKIIAAGQQITILGSADNLLAAGNNVVVGSGAHIRGDAEISAETVSQEGTVDGKWNAAESGFSFPAVEEIKSILLGLLFLFRILITIGFFILGLVLIYLLPEQWKTLTSGTIQKPFHVFLYGLGTVIITFILAILLLFTVIGIPLSLLVFLILGIVTLIAPLIVSSALGTWICRLMKKEVSQLIAYILGFILILVLSLIPFIGILVIIVVVLMGIGTIVRTLYHVKTNCCSG